MKIVELRAENFKRLTAVSIKPDGSLVQITGKNGQGKTSVLDSLWVAFAGKEACPAVPIRKGQERATVRVDMGELIVTRTFSHSKAGDYTTQIVVENADGARFPSPQKTIDGLLGALSFDPLEFARMAPKDQFNALRRFVPEVDFEAIANADRGDRERRTEVGRNAREQRAGVELITVPKDTPEQKVDETALVGELETAGQANAQLEQRRANRERLAREADGHRAKAKDIADDIVDCRAQIQDLQERIEALEQQQVAASDRAVAIDKQLNDAGPLPAMVDTTAIRARIDQARSVNGNVDRLLERRRREVRADQLEKEVDTLTARIDLRQAEKVKAIAAAKMPVEGLGFGDGEILLNGLPFQQASDAEQLRTSVAIAMALNPKLRVIRVRDGSLLDEDALKLLGEVAAAQDFQVWIERVDSSGKVGFVLEDGHLAEKSAPQPAEGERAAGV